MRKKIDSILYSLLVDGNIVPKEALDNVIGKNKHQNGAFWLAELSNMGVVNETAVLERLASRLGIQYRSVKDFEVDAGLFNKIPVKIASHYQFLPLKLEGNVLTAAVYYPLDINTQDEIRFQLGYEVSQILTPRADVLDLLKKYYGIGAQTIEKMFLKEGAPAKKEAEAPHDVEDIEKEGEDATIANLVNEIIIDAYKKRATDIHIEPYRDQVRMRYRVDGILYESNVPPSVRHFIAPILSRIKIMSNLDIVEHRLPQDGQVVVKVGDERLDLRVSFIPTPFGESVVIRILPTVVLYDINRLGLNEKDRDLIEELIKRPNGIIFVTGPTGSGKTTTLYACLNKLNNADVKIITIEDPIEYEMKGMTQIQVNPQVGLDFAAGLRSILRHDPDIIMVGEVRDRETAEIAIRVALTGHLVFSTLHTNSAAASVHRLLDIGIEPFLIHSSTVAFIAQRLVRVLCPSCKKPAENVKDNVMNYIKSTIGMPPGSEFKLFTHVGCDKCNKTGFLGRTAIYEILTVTDAVRELIEKRASSGEIEKTAVYQGMRTLLVSGLQKAAEGTTSLEEILNILPECTFSLTGEERSSEKQAATQAVPATPKQKSQDERRTYARMDQRLPVSFTIYKGVSKDSRQDARNLGISEADYWKEHNVYSENISSGGLIFKNKFPLNAGIIINMAVDVPFDTDEGSVINCMGRVIRMEKTPDDNYKLAVCFLDMSSRDRTELNKHVENILGGG